jgi:fatty acid desaturase
MPAQSGQSVESEPSASWLRASRRSYSDASWAAGCDAGASLRNMVTALRERTVDPTSPRQVRGLAQDAREMTVLSPRLIAYNVGYLALAWAVATGALLAFWIHPAWYTFVLAFLLVSSRHQALLNCEHECIHRKFLPNLRWNDIVGRYLCAAPVGSPYGASRARHLSHHRLLGTDEDPDRDLHAGPATHTRGGLARHFVGGLLGGYAGMVLMGPRVPRNEGAAATPWHDLVSLVAGQLLVATGLTLAFDWWVYPALWLAPLVTVTVLFHLVRSFVEHAITEDETEAHEDRLITIPSNWVERSLVAPYFMNYHAEHHLLPSVPAPRLRQLQQRLADRADTPPVLVRASYRSALMRYVRAVRD